MERRARARAERIGRAERGVLANPLAAALELALNGGDKERLAADRLVRGSAQFPAVGSPFVASFRAAPHPDMDRTERDQRRTAQRGTATTRVPLRGENVTFRRVMLSGRASTPRSARRRSIVCRTTRISISANDAPRQRRTPPPNGTQP